MHKNAPRTNRSALFQLRAGLVFSPAYGRVSTEGSQQGRWTKGPGTPYDFDSVFFSESVFLSAAGAAFALVLPVFALAVFTAFASGFAAVSALTSALTSAFTASAFFAVTLTLSCAAVPAAGAAAKATPGTSMAIAKMVALPIISFFLSDRAAIDGCAIQQIAKLSSVY